MKSGLGIKEVVIFLVGFTVSFTVCYLISIYTNSPFALSYVFPFLSAFILGLSTIKTYMKLMQKLGIVGKDIHKREKKIIPEMGGIVVIACFIFGLLMHIAVMTFIYKTSNAFTELFAVALSIMIIAIIGLFDDLLRKTGSKQGLKQWVKPALSLAAALPLMVISAGQSTMALPIFGIVNFGSFYPLIIIPLLLVFVSNAINLLGGFNGLEAGMSLIACASMAIYGIIFNVPIVVAIMASMCGAIFLFLLFNKYPAKIFPGDTFTYAVGATIAATMIVGNMERFGLIILTPWIIEFLLKLRAKFKTECYGELQEEDIIKCRYKSISSLTHIVMKMGKFKEWQISLILILFEIIICLFAFGVTI